MHFLSALFCCLVLMIPGARIAHAAQIVNVDYIAQYTKRTWNIDVPYRAEQKMHAANTEYLLGVVDWLNKKINGKQTTNYGTGPYATRQAADTIATIRAIDTLVKPEYKFFFTPATSDNTYGFRISAAGVFMIDWGDGDVEKILKTDTTIQTITHTFPAPANGYKISLGGIATQYAKDGEAGAIMFYDGNETKNAFGIKSMSGCLGCVFATLDNSVDDQLQPRFSNTFTYNTQLTQSIPAGLFNGVHGQPTNNMFVRTFRASGLTGPIPDDLFSGLVGKPATWMFAYTFNVTKFSGPIPSGLFRGISGPPAPGMFLMTFRDAPNLTSIPDDLFGDISGPLETNSFAWTFYGGYAMRGESAKINGRYLYEIWPNATKAQVDLCYHGTSGLDDWDDIPTTWGGPKAIE